MQRPRTEEALSIFPAPAASMETEGLLDAVSEAGLRLWSFDPTTETFECRSRRLGRDGPETRTLAEALVHLHPEDAPRCRAALERLLAGGGPEHLELRVLRGSEVGWLSVHARLIGCCPRSRRVVGGTRDVTEERMLEGHLAFARAETARKADELRESRSSAAYSQQLAAVGTFEIVLGEANALEGATVLLGDAASRILGLPVGETLALERAFAMVHPDELDEVRTAVVEALTGGQSFVTQARVLRPDGTTRFVRTMAKRVVGTGGPRFVGAVHDATDWFETDQRERARAAALASSEATLRAILASSLDTVVMIDERGVIEQVNATVTRMFGYTEEELVGQNVKVLMPPHDRARHDQYLARYLETGHKRIIGIVREVVCLRKDGTTFLAELSVTEFVVGGRRHYAGVLHDITERRRTDLEVANAELRVRTSLAYDLHDLVGQHLAGARMLTGNLRSEAPQHLQPRLTRIKELLRDAVEHVRGMSRELAAMDLVEAPLPDALRAVGASLRPLFGPAITIVVDDDFVDPPKEEKVHAFLVVREAMLNAAKHAEAASVTVTFRYENPWYSISVADDGRGIQGSESTGIGLSSMRYRARLLGGHTRVVTREGGGTEVLLRWSTAAACAAP